MKRLSWFFIVGYVVFFLILFISEMAWVAFDPTPLHGGISGPTETPPHPYSISIIWGCSGALVASCLVLVNEYNPEPLKNRS